MTGVLAVTAQDLTCPYCKATPQTWCRTRRSTRLAEATHDARLHAAIGANEVLALINAAFGRSE